MKRIATAVAKTVALYSFAGWLYVAATALARPNTLPWQLTHLAHWPRTDTFGEICFVISVVSFLTYELLRSVTTPSQRVDILRRSNDRGD